MVKIVKGALVLPFALAVVFAVIAIGTLVMMLAAFFCALIVAIIPFVLKLAALSFLFLGTLWLLGAGVSARK